MPGSAFISIPRPTNSPLMLPCRSVSRSGVRKLLYSSRQLQPPKMYSNTTAVSDKPEFCGSQIADFRHGVASDRIIGDRPVPVAFAQDSSQVGDSLPLDAANVALEKLLITQSDVETLGPVSDKGRRAHLIDVVEPDVLEHIIEEFERGVARQAQQAVVEADVVITPLDSEMDFGSPQPVLEVAVVRPMLERLLVGLNRIDPMMRSLLLDSRIDRRRQLGRGFFSDSRPIGPRFSLSDCSG